MVGPVPGRSLRLVGRLLPAAVALRRARAGGVVRGAVRRSRPVDLARRGRERGRLVGRRPARVPWSPGRTWTRCWTAARTTGRWAWSLPLLRSMSCGRGVSRRPGRSGVSVFVEEEGSRFGLACLGSRLATGAVSWAAARELRDRSGCVPRRRALGRGPVGLAGSRAAGGCRDVRGAARRAGPRPGRPRRSRRCRERDLAARAVPLRVRRRRRPRRHHADGGPRRPDAHLRDDRAGRQQAGPPGRPARHLRPARGDPELDQLGAVGRDGVAGRAGVYVGRPRGARRGRSSGRRRSVRLATAPRWS